MDAVGSADAGATYCAVEWQERHDDTGLSTGPLRRSSQPKCCVMPTTRFSIVLSCGRAPESYAACVKAGSLPHISPIGVMRSHEVAPAASPSYAKVPKTQPVVASALLSRTATSICNKRTVAMLRVFDPGGATKASHSKLSCRYGTCAIVAAVKSSLHATLPSGNRAAVGSGFS